MAIILRIISAGAQVFEYIVKGIQIAEAGKTVYDTIQDPKLSGKDKTKKVVINCFFMVAQGAEMVTHARGSSERWQVGMKFVAGAGDVARVIDSGADTKEIVARVGYRVLDMGGCYVDHHPETSEGIKSALSFAESTLMLYSDRKKVSESIELLKRLKDCRIFHQGRFFRFQVPANQPAAAPSATAPQEVAAAPAAADVIPVQLEGVLIEHGEELGEEVEAVVRTREIGEWQTIPSLFITDAVLGQTLCSITHQPIRFLLVVMVTRDLENPIYYERAEITRWLEEHPPEQPPAWPPGVPVQMAALSVFPHMQAQINRRLQQLLDDARGAAAEFLRRGTS